MKLSTEQQPGDSEPRRGRKPGGSRTARERESLRKLNHSIIEKARRTKINETLATLKQLIPPDFGNDVEDVDCEDNRKKRKQKGDKEFKLEILVRTVAYMQVLLDKVAVLEAGQRCTNCHRPEELPSISSWLPQIDPALAQLPSPPASTHFSPIIPAQVPPLLSLDEHSAASLLLQIGSAPYTPHTPSSLLDMRRK